MNNQFLVKGYLFLCLSVICCEAFTQKALLSGLASVSDTNENEGIMVQLLDAKGEMVVAFRTTDDQGKFTMADVKYNTYTLSYSQFGYKDTSFIIVCNAPDVLIQLITLRPLSITTDELSIIEKAVLFRKSGDSTIFNLKAFETGTEQSVTDILGKIPGFEINGTDIFYNGKSLEAILVEGRDISDQKQTELTDAVLYKAVKDIRLIQNYNKDQGIVLDSTKLGTAVDIKLRPEYQGKLQFTSQASAGFADFYGLGASALSASAKSAMNIQVMHDNLNDQDVDEYMSSFFEKIERDRLFDSNASLLIQLEQNDTNNVLIGNVNSKVYSKLKLIQNTTVSKKINVRNKILIDRSNTSNSMNGFRIYRTSQVDEQVNRSVGQVLQGINAHSNWTFRLHQNADLKLQLPVNYSSQDRIAQTNNTINTTAFSNINNQDGGNFRIAPFYHLTISLPKSTDLQVFGIYSIENNTSYNDYLSDAPILGINSFNTADNSYTSNQTKAFYNKNLRNNIRLQNKLKMWTFTLNLAHENNQETLDLSTSIPSSFPYTGVDALSFQAFNQEFKISYRGDKVRGGLSLKTGYSALDHGSENYNKRLVAPELFFMVELPYSMNVSTSYKVGITQPTLQNITNLYSLESQVENVTGGLSTNAYGKKATYTFSIFKDPFLSIQTGNLFNSSISYSPKTNVIQPLFINTGIYQIRSFQQVQSDNLLNTSLSISQKIKNLTLRFRNRASSVDLLLNGVNNRDRSLFSDFDIDYLERQVFSVHGGFSFNYTERNTQIFKNTNIFYRPEFGASLFKYKFDHRAYYVANINAARGRTVTYHRLNYIITRKKFLSKFDLSLSFNDIFNFRATPVPVNSISDNYFDTFYYENFPGRVIFGLKGYF